MLSLFSGYRVAHGRHRSHAREVSGCQKIGLLSVSVPRGGTVERVMCEMRHRFGDTRASSDGCYQSEKLGPGWGMANNVFW